MLVFQVAHVKPATALVGTQVLRTKTWRLSLPGHMSDPTQVVSVSALTLWNLFMSFHFHLLSESWHQQGPGVPEGPHNAAWTLLTSFLPFGIQSPISSSVPTNFCSQKLWGLTFLALEPWTGGLVLDWDSSLPRYPSRIFIHHMQMWDQPILYLCPSYQSGWKWFL